jgi:GNAT superfamily N-acetyltransferase
VPLTSARASPLRVLPSVRVPARKPPTVSIRPARPGEAPPDADLAHARATDPDGAFVASDPEGRVCGWAAVAVREDALLLLALEVSPAHRGKGVGRALLAAARAYGAARGARAMEVLAPEDSSALSFFLRAGLSLRTLVLGLAVEASEVSQAPPPSLHAVGAGASLYGWIAALDRETRGFARPRDWARWAAAGHVVSQKRGGRAVAIGTWSTGPSGAALGPIAARTPEAAAELLPLLVPLAGGSRFSLALPAEARALLLAAASLGFRAVTTRVLLADRRRGDLRRYAGGGGLFF